MDLRGRRVPVDPLRGARFHAFLPLGNRANLEYEISYLGKKIGFGYSDIMSMPSSRRHRLVKLHEEIDRQQEVQRKNQSKRRFK